MAFKDIFKKKNKKDKDLAIDPLPTEISSPSLPDINIPKDESLNLEKPVHPDKVDSSQDYDLNKDGSLSPLEVDNLVQDNLVQNLNKDKSDSLLESQALENKTEKETDVSINSPEPIKQTATPKPVKEEPSLVPESLVQEDQAQFQSQQLVQTQTQTQDATQIQSVDSSGFESLPEFSPDDFKTLEPVAPKQDFAQEPLISNSQTLKPIDESNDAHLFGSNPKTSTDSPLDLEEYAPVFVKEYPSSSFANQQGIFVSKKSYVHLLHYLRDSLSETDLLSQKQASLVKFDNSITKLLKKESLALERLHKQIVAIEPIILNQ